MTPFALAAGTVARFDEQVGLGEIRGTNGDAVSFHSVEIADGSRFIEVGTAVVFALRPRRPGLFEATAIHAVGTN